MKKIIATGRLTNQFGEYKWHINYSSILTELIKCAGKCTYYASDLFIEWESVVNNLNNPDYEGGSYKFGFRDSGVDNAKQILSNRDNPNHYNCIRALTITVDEDEMTMELTEEPVVIDAYKLPAKYSDCCLEDASAQAACDALYSLCRDFGIEFPSDYDEDDEFTNMLCTVSVFLENHA